jgi:hypothetical protein
VKEPLRTLWLALSTLVEHIHDEECCESGCRYYRDAAAVVEDTRALATLEAQVVQLRTLAEQRLEAIRDTIAQCAEDSDCSVEAAAALCDLCRERQQDAEVIRALLAALEVGTSVGAVDPHASHSGTPSTRV